MRVRVYSHGKTPRKSSKEDPYGAQKKNGGGPIGTAKNCECAHTPLPGGCPLPLKVPIVPRFCLDFPLVGLTGKLLRGMRRAMVGAKLCQFSSPSKRRGPTLRNGGLWGLGGGGAIWQKGKMSQGMGGFGLGLACGVGGLGWAVGWSGRLGGGAWVARWGGPWLALGGLGLALGGLPWLALGLGCLVLVVVALGGALGVGLAFAPPMVGGRQLRLGLVGAWGGLGGAWLGWVGLALGWLGGAPWWGVLTWGREGLEKLVLVR